MDVMVERKPKPKQEGCPQGTPHHHWQIETERDADNRSLGKCRNCQAERLFWNGLDHEGPRGAYGQYVTGEARLNIGRGPRQSDANGRGIFNPHEDLTNPGS